MNFISGYVYLMIYLNMKY
ncbi:hypothetical protein SBY92_002971 [Candida maltosa Xu316]